MDNLIIILLFIFVISIIIIIRLEKSEVKYIKSTFLNSNSAIRMEAYIVKNENTFAILQATAENLPRLELSLAFPRESKNHVSQNETQYIQQNEH